MNPLSFIRKEPCPISCPLFSEGSEDNYFYTELFNYYHSLKGKTIDTSNGESLFPIRIDSTHSINGGHLQIIRCL